MLNFLAKTYHFVSKGCLSYALISTPHKLNCHNFGIPPASLIKLETLISHATAHKHFKFCKNCARHPNFVQFHVSGVRHPPLHQWSEILRGGVNHAKLYPPTMHHVTCRTNSSVIRLIYIPACSASTCE